MWRRTRGPIRDGLGAGGRARISTWITFDSIRGSGFITDSENVASLTDNGGAGDFTITFAQPYASTEYACAAAALGTTAWPEVYAVAYQSSTVILATSVRILVRKAGGTAVDSGAVSLLIAGDQ